MARKAYGCKTALNFDCALIQDLNAHQQTFLNKSIGFPSATSTLQKNQIKL